MKDFIKEFLRRQIDSDDYIFNFMIEDYAKECNITRTEAMVEFDETFKEIFGEEF